MVRTLIGIFIALAMIAGISYCETALVHKTFRDFEVRLTTLYKKTEAKQASYEDGRAVRNYWSEQKRTLHIWIPHTSIESVDYQLNEALGYLYEENHEDAIPKIEVLIEMCKKIPRTYEIRLENVF